MFLEKSVLKIRCKFTGEYPCRSVISIKLLCNFTEITLRHGCSPVNLLHIFRTPFTENTSGRLLLYYSILTWTKSKYFTSYKIKLHWWQGDILNGEQEFVSKNFSRSERHIYKMLIKRGIFDDSDEIGFRLSFYWSFWTFGNIFGVAFALNFWFTVMGDLKSFSS